MDITFMMILGFFFAAYAVTANDSIQTLGTYISSNHDIKWYWQYMFMGSIGLATMWYGFNIVGDPAFGRLSKFPFQDIKWYHAIAPAVLLILTRLKIPVSTTFLVLSVFATDVILEKMLVKSFLGYGVSFGFSAFAWYIISKYFLDESQKFPNTHNMYWRIGQWVTTGWLWSTWLKHDLANIMVFLPRFHPASGSFTHQILVYSVMLIGLGYMFYVRGGKIQEIVLAKTNTRYVRSATLIDLVYCFVLYFFKELNDIPMSTTFVFMGMLAGREMAINFAYGHRLTYGKQKRHGVFPMLYIDFLRLMFGLAISVAIAFGIEYI